MFSIFQEDCLNYCGNSYVISIRILLLFHSGSYNHRTWIHPRQNSLFLKVMIFVAVQHSSCGKVMFSQASVFLSTGGGVHPRADPPPGQTPPLADSPLRQTPPPRLPLQPTVHILLECILVATTFA